MSIIFKLLVILYLVIIMNKKNRAFLIFTILALTIGVGVFIWINSNKNNFQNNYEASRVSSKNNINESSKNNDSNNLNSNTSNTANNTLNAEIQTSDKNNDNTPPAPQIKEEQIAIFSTKVYAQDSARQNNISITCNTLNDTIVKNGETFSFCNTVGQASTEKGYQEADIFDNKGNKKKGLGGGNCQISTTLYNAVLSIPSLVVTERHPHSNYVPYIQKGKDAAVAYGSYDFKFRNDTGNDIKIRAESNSSAVTVSLIALKNL